LLLLLLLLVLLLLRLPAVLLLLVVVDCLRLLVLPLLLLVWVCLRDRNATKLEQHRCGMRCCGFMQQMSKNTSHVQLVLDPLHACYADVFNCAKRLPCLPQLNAHKSMPLSSMVATNSTR
jgi:hypothetical protein